MLVRMESSRDSHSLLVEMQNGTPPLEDSLAVSYKTKHTLTIGFSNYTSSYSPIRVENIRLHENMLPKLESNRYMSLSRRIDKLLKKKDSYFVHLA